MPARSRARGFARRRDMPRAENAASAFLEPVGASIATLARRDAESRHLLRCPPPKRATAHAAAKIRPAAMRLGMIAIDAILPRHFHIFTSIQYFFHSPHVIVPSTITYTSAA